MSVNACAGKHSNTLLGKWSPTAVVRFLSTQLAELDPQLLALITQHPTGPARFAKPGVGPFDFA